MVQGTRCVAVCQKPKPYLYPQYPFWNHCEFTCTCVQPCLWISSSWDWSLWKYTTSLGNKTLSLITFQDFKCKSLAFGLKLAHLQFSTPSGCDGGSQKMISITHGSRQPVWQAWAMDRWIHEWSILLRMAINTSTATTYTSAMNSYLTFCKLHNIPINTTTDTLSYFITFLSSHINPKSDLPVWHL